MHMGRARMVRAARTAKQRAAAKAYQQHANVTIAPASAGIPATSWWIGLSRPDLQDTAERERARMSQSKFGRVAIATYSSSE